MRLAACRPGARPGIVLVVLLLLPLAGGATVGGMSSARGRDVTLLRLATLLRLDPVRRRMRPAVVVAMEAGKRTVGAEIAGASTVIREDLVDHGR